MNEIVRAAEAREMLLDAAKERFGKVPAEHIVVYVLQVTQGDRLARAEGSARGAAVTMMFPSDAGGVGLNLQRAATCCINLELPWNPAVLEQRIGRIYRLGQTHPIDVYNLVADQGIEARIAQLVADKKAVFTTLFDGTTDSVRFDGAHSFLEGVKKIVDAPELPAVHGGGASEDADAEGDLDPSIVPSSIEQPAREGQAPRSIVDGLAGLSISTLPTGAIRIDAPPELAAPLASMFEALARSLRERA